MSSLRIIMACVHGCGAAGVRALPLVLAMACFAEEVHVYEQTVAGGCPCYRRPMMLLGGAASVSPGFGKAVFSGSEF